MSNVVDHRVLSTEVSELEELLKAKSALLQSNLPFRAERRVVVIGDDGTMYATVAKAVEAYVRRSSMQHLLDAVELQKQQRLVGRRVKVFWSGDKKFFFGTVKKVSSDANFAFVQYDDGDACWEKDFVQISNNKREKTNRLSKRCRITTRKLGFNDGWDVETARVWASL